MSHPQSLHDRWSDLAAQLLELGPMRPGSICSQKVKYRAADGSVRANGPYPILTFKEEQKTRTLRLRSSAQADLARQQVENFRRFGRLTRELARIGRELADAELAAAQEGKKNSASAWRASASGKRRRSSSA